MNTVSVPSDQVRVPEVTAGTVTAVRRYDHERAYVLHPDDFRRLTELDELATRALACAPVDPSEAAVAAHREESAEGETVTDPDLLRALLEG